MRFRRVAGYANYLSAEHAERGRKAREKTKEKIKTESSKSFQNKSGAYPRMSLSNCARQTFARDRAQTRPSQFRGRLVLLTDLKIMYYVDSGKKVLPREYAFHRQGQRATFTAIIRYGDGFTIKIIEAEHKRLPLATLLSQGGGGMVTSSARWISK